jgi:predicted NAD/FAD-dependent oxidoreductase
MLTRKGMCDLGAQYFTISDPAFKRYIELQGKAQLWNARIGALNKGGVIIEKSGTNRFVGVPGMSEVCRGIQCGEVRYQTKVDRIQWNHERKEWNLEIEGSEEGIQCDWVVITTPPNQAYDILKHEQKAQSVLAKIDKVEMEKCWAVGIVLSGKSGFEFDGVFCNGFERLSWIARDSSKPGRNLKEETWTLHANSQWSEETFEKDQNQMADEMIQEFKSIANISSEISIQEKFIQRWKYAKAKNPLPESDGGFLIDESLRLLVAGDWTCGSKVEGAFLSGHRAALRLIELVKNAEKSSL